MSLRSAPTATDALMDSLEADGFWWALLAPPGDGASMEGPARHRRVA